MLLFVSLGLALPPAMATDLLRLATTTTVQASGVMDVLLPAFEAASGYQASYVAVGSGVKVGGTSVGVTVKVGVAVGVGVATVAVGDGSSSVGDARGSMVAVGASGVPVGLSVGT